MFNRDLCRFIYNNRENSRDQFHHNLALEYPEYVDYFDCEPGYYLLTGKFRKGDLYFYAIIEEPGYYKVTPYNSFKLMSNTAVGNDGPKPVQERESETVEQHMPCRN
jgi:hypothetical protein